VFPSSISNTAKPSRLKLAPIPYHPLAGLAGCGTLWSQGCCCLAMMPVFGADSPHQRRASAGLHLSTGRLRPRKRTVRVDWQGFSVQLTAKSPDGGPMSADTDDSGHYEFKDLKPGSYTILHQSGRILRPLQSRWS